jgi:hypothetical protein
MAHALLLIAMFHAVLWLGVAVLTALEPRHPMPAPRMAAPRMAAPVSPQMHDVDEADEGSSLRPAA